MTVFKIVIKKTLSESTYRRCKIAKVKLELLVKLKIETNMSQSAKLNKNNNKKERKKTEREYDKLFSTANLKKCFLTVHSSLFRSPCTQYLVCSIEITCTYII